MRRGMRPDENPFFKNTRGRPIRKIKGRVLAMTQAALAAQWAQSPHTPTARARQPAVLTLDHQSHSGRVVKRQTF